MSSLKSQISKLQSKADKQTHSRSRSRSKTPKKERHGVSSNKKKAVKIAPTAHDAAAKIGGGFFRSHKDDANWWAQQKHAPLDFKKQIMAMNPLLEKKRQYDLRMKSAVSVTCTHMFNADAAGIPASYSMNNLPQNLKTDDRIVCIWCKMKARALFDPNYTGGIRFDEKAVVLSNTDDLKSLYEMVCKEYDMARNAMRAGLKDRPIKMQISCPFVLTTTVTSGVTNTVNIAGSTSNALLPSLCTEWNTLANLFDEYKCTGGECVFNYVNPIGIGGTSPVAFSDGLPIMAYDNDQSTPLSSTLVGTQYSQHKILDALLGQSGVLAACPASGVRHNFRWHVPRGTVVAGPANNAIPGTEWCTVAGVTAAGWLLFYHLGTCILANNTGAGIIYFHTEFRCRS